MFFNNLSSDRADQEEKNLSQRESLSELHQDDSKDFGCRFFFPGRGSENAPSVLPGPESLCNPSKSRSAFP